MKLLSQSLGTCLEMTQFPFPALQTARYTHYHLWAKSIVKLRKLLLQFALAVLPCIPSFPDPSHPPGAEEGGDDGCWALGKLSLTLCQQLFGKHCQPLPPFCSVIACPLWCLQHRCWYSCKCHRCVIINSLLHRRLLLNKTWELRVIQKLEKCHRRAGGNRGG